MPRPGPRPYECVKRAWHSERHQPIRGSLIQQILRLAKEIHKPATKGNREWQEKLPVVVFKAEEIMYSKANSEAEYVNPDTLWKRVNDAVNTIIRRDESTETGDLLPPCVEAALHLGCVPVRASRSQRHSNPRSYLSPRANDGPVSPPMPPPLPPRIWDRTDSEQCPQSSPLHLSKQPIFMRAAGANAPVSVSGSEPYSQPSASHNQPVAADKCPLFQQNISAGRNQLMAMGTGSLNFGSVYPLHHETHSQQEGHQNLRTVSNTVLVGKPVGTSPMEPARMGIASNIFSFSGVRQLEIASNRTFHEDVSNHDYPLEKQCDLSLRLGLFSDQPTRMEREEATPSSSQSRGSFGIASQERDKGFCFFPTTVPNEPSGFYPSKRLRVGESSNNDATSGKPKATFGSNVQEGRFSWQPDYHPNQFSGHTRGPGL